ncbi:hypothetical protein [Vitiosangium sp. GDMCC 1.1324]|uniref:hypothetical protein n=1 Tax=Vitiosangium sp. (strain GDMCC 1.1324) TaxID=2138576 RepID=UPI000D3BDFA8|nr:hypothetical protein [Vitiosangium sp. GDMCC 1.1324]PTL82415.1 hypothetical protein DAT35_16495 [Vitiosangium sp. GDMCC 1.1324]
MKGSKQGVVVLVLIVLALGVALVTARSGTRGGAGSDSRTDEPAAQAAATPSGGAPARTPSGNPGGGPQAGTPRKGDSSKPREVIAELGWGSGPSQLGRERLQEGNPEAPMSLAVTPLGDVVVLDQVNGRLVRLDGEGKVLGTTPLTQQTPQDVTVAKDGSLLVLDRLKDKSVAIIDPYTGSLRGELPLQGEGIPNTGGITGTFVEGDSVYVEREHGALIRIGDLSGKVDTTRPEIPGRPTRDGRAYILARIIDAPGGRLFVNAVDRQSGQHRYTREYRLQFPLLFITLLDSDRSGVIYLGVAGELPTGKASPASEAGVRLFCLDPVDGKVLGQTDLPLNTMPEETFRDFTVLDEGGVVYQYRTENGVSLRRADCH